MLRLRFSDNETIEDPKDFETIPQTPMARSNSQILGIILYLSIIQGTVLGFCLQSTIVLLAEKSITYKAAGLLLLAKFPINIKLFFAPILDSYYIRSFGRRKSYLVPCEIFIGICFLYLAFNIKSMLAKADVEAFMLTNTVMMVFMAIHNIAEQGLVIHFHGSHQTSLASACQVAGNVGGIALSYFMLIPLSSYKFCQEHLGLSKEILSIESFMYVFAGIAFLGAILVYFIVSENDNHAQITQLSYFKIASMWKGFWENGTLRRYLLILIFCKLGMAPILSIFDVMIIQKGFKKENLSNIEAITLPIPLILSFYIGRMIPSKREWSGYLTGQIFTVIGYCFKVAILFFYDPNSNEEVIPYYLVGAYCIYECGNVLSLTLKNAFDLRIAEPAIESSYFTFISSFTRFGESWPLWLMPMIIDSQNYVYLQIGGGCFSILLWLTNYKFLREMETLPKSHFKVTADDWSRFLEFKTTSSP